MKILGCLGVAVLVVAGFFALAAYFIVRGDDMSALTERVELTVVDTREVSRGSEGSGYSFDYAYEAGGRWYGATEKWIDDDYWSPGDPYSACIDPEQPEDHVLTLYDEKCGEKRIAGNFIQQATPRPAPR